jgi:hypothetical protein
VKKRVTSKSTKVSSRIIDFKIGVGIDDDKPLLCDGEATAMSVDETTFPGFPNWILNEKFLFCKLIEPSFHIPSNANEKMSFYGIFDHFDSIFRSVHDSKDRMPIFPQRQSRA